MDIGHEALTIATAAAAVALTGVGNQAVPDLWRWFFRDDPAGFAAEHGLAAALVVADLERRDELRRQRAERARERSAR